ncbi:MAG TPA: hypothetical protein VJJ47_01345 [Candidatus Paceibacterota bacterium]
MLPITLAVAGEPVCRPFASITWKDSPPLTVWLLYCVSWQLKWFVREAGARGIIRGWKLQTFSSTPLTQK